MRKLSSQNFLSLFLFFLILGFPSTSISYETEVTAIKLKRNNQPSTIKLNSSAMAFQEYTLSSEVAGNIIKVSKLEGDKVSKDKVFAIINPTKYEIALKQAQEDLFAIEAKLRKSSLKLQRYHQLLTKEIVSQEEFEEVFYEEQNLLSKFNSQFESVKKAELDLDQCNIKPNFSGIISKKYIKEGDFVDIGDPLFEITNNEILEVSIYIPDLYINKIHKGSNVSMETSDAKRINTTIDAIINKIENTTGTFMGKIYLDNSVNIIPGQEIIVEIELSSEDNLLRINKDCVNNTQDGKFVYKIIKDKVYPVKIEIIEDQDGYFLAKGDIEEGDIIVLDGNETLMPNQKVKVISIKE